VLVEAVTATAVAFTVKVEVMIEDPVVVEEPMVVAVAAKEPVVVEEPVVAEEVEAAVDAEAMAQQIVPRIPNTIQAQRPTAGLVVLMCPKSMIAIPVATNYRGTKIQQPDLI
jgi:hypothetical protein